MSFGCSATSSSQPTVFLAQSEVVSAVRQGAGSKFICWPSSIRDDQQGTASCTFRRECSICQVMLTALLGAHGFVAVKVEETLGELGLLAVAAKPASSGRTA